MQTATTDNQLAIIEKSLPVFQQAGTILKNNQSKTQKALVVGNSILTQWQQAWAIEDNEERWTALLAADERSNKYLVNCSTALKDEKEARAVVTQIMDEMKKMFTSCENDIDRTKANTVPSKVQEFRDQLAAELAKEEKRKREEAERKAAKAREIIELKAKAETLINDHYQNQLLAAKQKITNAFNGATIETIETIDAVGKKINDYTPVFNGLVGFSVNTLTAIYHSREEVIQLLNETIANRTPDFTSNYVAEMTSLKQDILDKLPSKASELLQIAKAGEQEKKRLEAEQKQREEAEQQRLQQEAEEAKRQNELKVQMDAEAGKTMVLFEQEAELSETAAAPEARQGYEITVLHPAGFVQIFQLWFEKEGKNLPVDKIGNTKLDQMKAFCEKIAHKNNEKIESKFLKYEPCYKAVNRKPVKA